ncbi:MAG: hypothetical protein JWO87_31 [Phycisphaerales bacterium]|nr:hypothetical protein [Phycisphaerales bacterium]MDB5298368.1 hypothetical protein [Phycisphaerales bacterium]MDB5305342.1 hypothetical protein [Phycisphaerales bacterium]
MSDQTTPTLINRIGNWLRRGGRQGDELSNDLSARASDGAGDGNLPAVTNGETRSTFLRPWVKRDATIDQLQNGVAALSELMGTIRDNLEKQAHRQDDLLDYLSHLPQALQSLPESSRVQGEALKAIQEQIRQQNGQQGKLAEVLERIHRADGEHRSTLSALQERVETIGKQEESIGRSLSGVGTALETVSRNSEASAQVLTQLRDNISSRDTDLEAVIRKQNTRFTTMLTVAIVLSMAALTAVVIFGYLGYVALSQHAR